ncbi:unnamed protein product [Rhizophagus irregularis]|nr:unnamed protein product [Rhizophagus irregularis]
MVSNSFNIDITTNNNNNKSIININNINIKINENDEIFLKNVLKEFYNKIIQYIKDDDINKFEENLIKWLNNIIKNHDEKYSKKFLELMKNHKKYLIWFTSIIGFFYQHGISCYKNNNIALEFYNLTINNNIDNIDNIDDEKEHLINYYNDINFDQKNLIKDDENELRNINIIIGKYLLSFFYYKDIILNKKKFINNVKEIIITKNLTFKIDKNSDNNKNDIIKQVNNTFEDYLKSAENGNTQAQNNLGNCYQYGIGTDKDEKQAFAWYLKAAQSGYTQAQYDLAICYKNGLGTEKDEKQAFEWYLKAAENGDARAQNDLAICYQNGIGTDKDVSKAFEWNR